MGKGSRQGPGPQAGGGRAPKGPRARRRGRRGERWRENDAPTLQLGRWLNRAGAHGALARAQRPAKQEGRRAPDRHCTAPGCCRCVKARVSTSALELDMERRAAGSVLEETRTPFGPPGVAARGPLARDCLRRR